MQSLMVPSLIRKGSEDGSGVSGSTKPKSPQDIRLISSITFETGAAHGIALTGLYHVS